MSNALSVQAHAATHPHLQSITTSIAGKLENQKDVVKAEPQSPPKPHKVDLKV